jgi:uncharacterized membrane protein YhaH (DUF805 family)
MKHYFTVLKKYASVEGRASRAEYWNFLLFSYLVSVVLTIIEIRLHTNFIVMTYTVAMFLPSLAVGMRRMHDLGKYGGYALIPIYSHILACFPSSKGINIYNFIPEPNKP